MGTPCKTVIDAFLRLVETDRDFFSYFRVDDATAMHIAKQRSITFLYEACSRVQMECMPVMDFTLDDVTLTYDEYDSSDEGTINCEFKFDLNGREIMLLSNLMYEAYMSRDISSLKLRDVNFTGTEMRVFDPSNARKTFMTMYESVKDRNDYLIDIYKNTDREDGSYNLIDYDSYDTSECKTGGCNC